MITPRTTLTAGQLARMDDDSLAILAGRAMDRMLAELQGGPPVDRSKAIAEALDQLTQSLEQAQTALRALGAELVDHMATRACTHQHGRHKEYQCPDCRRTTNGEPTDRLEMDGRLCYTCNHCGYFGSEWQILDTCDDCGREVTP